MCPSPVKLSEGDGEVCMHWSSGQSSQCGVSSWKGYPSYKGRKAGARRKVDPAPQSWEKG